MVQVTNFVLRWLYLSNLIQDRAEVQALPHHPYGHMPPPPPPHSHHHHHQGAGATSSSTTTQRGGSAATTATSSHSSRRDQLVEWRSNCLMGLSLYAPGTPRLLALDALRLEIVKDLEEQLNHADRVLQRYVKQEQLAEAIKSSQVQGDQDENGSLLVDDIFLDADLEIVNQFLQSSGSPEKEQSDEQALLVISERGDFSLNTPATPEMMDQAASFETDSSGRHHRHQESSYVSPQEVEAAQRLLLELREYLPQLVSAVLHSPRALKPDVMADPLASLQRLLLNRCGMDPNLGIELCWLLEAEVGRAWKKLFEHRQQTGRRLIVVLPADKAAVIGQIGKEKKLAFNLLQDAEQATAYGSVAPTNHWEEYYDGYTGDGHTLPRLPASLSSRRCSHFGDTMQFIDQMTEISLSLRRVPHIQRLSILVERLEELNRRLRRRMVTLGDVSLDVEDGCGPHDWPQASDVTMDMIQYSVHFPLEPKSVTWPGGKNANDPIQHSAAERTKTGVMRVLRVVSSECRLLSSRERCPFLVRVELAETGLEGSDARLYASGPRGLGATVEEAMGLGSNAFPDYRIPTELMATTVPRPRKTKVSDNESPTVESDSNSDDENENGGPEEDIGEEAEPEKEGHTLRGGWQSESRFYYPPDGDASTYPYPYDTSPQQAYDHWNQQEYLPHPCVDESQITNPSATMYSALLDKVFGIPYATQCEEVRQTSPFGHVKGWRLASFIVKAGEDIRREALVMQVISKLKGWFDTDIAENLRPWLRPFTIMCVGGDAGLLECITDSKSVDEVKKETDGFTTLRDYFERAYGPPGAYASLLAGHPGAPPPAKISFERAQENFLRSLVGYSLVCYILQIKDRHNANILMDRDGHIIHIDFGYVLGDTPKMAKVPIFSERAPFKLTRDFWEVLGGWNVSEGGLGVRFCRMFEAAFGCAAEHVDELVSLVEAAVMNICSDHDVARSLANGVRNRLRLRGPPGSTQHKTFIMNLVTTALTSPYTTTYDWLQKNMNGYI